jgi:hypothetical protein
MQTVLIGLFGLGLIYNVVVYAHTASDLLALENQLQESGVGQNQQDLATSLLVMRAPSPDGSLSSSISLLVHTAYCHGANLMEEPACSGACGDTAGGLKKIFGLSTIVPQEWQESNLNLFKTYINTHHHQLAALTINYNDTTGGGNGHVYFISAYTGRIYQSFFGDYQQRVDNLPGGPSATDMVLQHIDTLIKMSESTTSKNEVEQYYKELYHGNPEKYDNANKLGVKFRISAFSLPLDELYNKLKTNLTLLNAQKSCFKAREIELRNHVAAAMENINGLDPLCWAKESEPQRVTEMKNIIRAHCLDVFSKKFSD